MTSRRDTARQFGRLAAAYARSPGHARGADLQIVLNFLEPEADMVVLDVATGAGHTAVAVAQRVRYVVATDIAVPMIAETVRLADSRNLGNVSGLLADAESLPFPDACFDAVTCRIAAHHFAKPRLAVSEAARVLKRGGRFILEDSSSPEAPELDRFLNEIEKLRDPTHVRSWTDAEWRVMIAAAGLDFQWASIYRKRHRIDHWLDRAGVAAELSSEIHSRFAEAPAEARHYFEIEVVDTTAISFTDDKLILRAEKA